MSVRPATALFALVCAGGSAAAIGLALSEARATDQVVAAVSARERSGLVTTALVAVRNTTGRPQCVRVQVVAWNRAGHDLGSSPFTVVRLEPQAKRDVSARLSLSSREYDEELSSLRAHVVSCG